MSERNRVGALLFIALLAGCSGAKSRSNEEAGTAAAEDGPVITAARAEPATVALDRYLRPGQPASITADVHDFRSPIVDVRARFLQVPLELPMKNVGGNTWRAELTPQQLRMLSVSGQTMRYDASVVVKDEQGREVTSPQTFEVAIQAPDLAQS